MTQPVLAKKSFMIALLRATGRRAGGRGRRSLYATIIRSASSSSFGFGHRQWYRCCAWFCPGPAAKFADHVPARLGVVDVIIRWLLLLAVLLAMVTSRSRLYKPITRNLPYMGGGDALGLSCDAGHAGTDAAVPHHAFDSRQRHHRRLQSQ